MLSTDLSPAKKYEKTKELCKNITILALQGTDAEFRQRYAFLQDLYEAWSDSHQVQITDEDNNIMAHEESDASTWCLNENDNRDNSNGGSSSKYQMLQN